MAYTAPTTIITGDLVTASYMNTYWGDNIAYLYSITESGYNAWTAAGETWVYVSASTFKIVGADKTAKYTVGTKLKFTQTTAKYAHVLSSSFSTDTTITIAVNTDFTIANAVITSPYFSYGTPPDFPSSFTMAAPSWNVSYFDDGAGGQPTTNVYEYSINGRICTVSGHCNGTKAGTNANVLVAATYNGPAPNALYTGTNLYCVGSLYIYNSSDSTPHLGVMRYSGGGLAGDVTPNIGDNKTLQHVSFTMTYII